TPAPAQKVARRTPERMGTYPDHLAQNAGWLSVLAEEQIHALATHVLARHTEQGYRAIAVTSALAGEGKTTVTLALAEKLASSGKRILVIDLDTHRGTLSRAAELEDAEGAVESADSRDGAAPFHCYPTSTRGVWIMPTGVVNYSVGVPLLSPDRIVNLCQRAYEDHDIVLLDCPPLAPVADTHVIGEAVDGAILVVRAGATPRDILTRALDEIGKELFFACVLNRAQPDSIPYFREVYGYYRRDPG
ncbi:MAG: CpsD/CapB family tyrosine-protein kinase, partial [Planctomycetota bacterium]